MVTSPDRHIVHHGHAQAAHVQAVGFSISDFSRHILKEIAGKAHLQIVDITSVRRTVEDQARIFYKKHIVEPEVAKYKNPELAKIIAHARKLKAQGQSEAMVKTYLISAIEDVHGGPVSVSRHLGVNAFSEVFDVAHYSGPTTGAARHSYMTDKQAHAFLEACRKRMPHSITRLGHSSELGFKLQSEFHDEKCFHFEIRQPVFDKLEQTSGAMIV
jgi:hypothetical protein